MTVQLSPHKASKVLRDYFRGIPQTKIAKGTAVDQASVSHYASRFDKRASAIGLLAAGKEDGVFDEVHELRSLSIELYGSGLTAVEAKKGVNIIRAFLGLGVSPEQHTTLVQVCKKVDDPGFIHAAAKLCKIEQDTHKSYEEVVSRFEQVTAQLPAAEKQLELAQSELKSISSTVAKKKEELANAGAKLLALQQQAIAKEKDLEQQVDAKVKSVGIQYQDIDEVARIKKELANQGLDITTLMTLAKEYSNGSDKH